MIDATWLKAHARLPALGIKRNLGRRSAGTHKAILNSKLHAFCNANGRSLNFFITASKTSDYTARRPCPTTCPGCSGCRLIGTMMLNGPGTQASRRASSLAFRIANPAPCPSNTTSAQWYSLLRHRSRFSTRPTDHYLAV